MVGMFSLVSWVLATTVLDVARQEFRPGFAFVITKPVL
jgi:hypothetical protein